VQEVTVPPERVADKLEQWQDSHSVENLEEMTPDEVRSAELQFLNEVQRLKARYKRGRLVTPEMAQVAGYEPLTDSQLQDVRQCIQDEADRIQLNFEKARSRIERREAERRGEVRKDVAERVADSLPDINILSIDFSIEWPWRT
jgi:hypothetical protein